VGAHRCFDPAGRRQRALLFLAQLAALPAGYKVRGVYGWAHSDDLYLLAGRTHPWEMLLTDLARAGSVIEHNVGFPGEEPAPLYRITPAGMGEVARLLGESTPSVTPAGAADTMEGLYLPPRRRQALETLRKATGREWLSPDAFRELPAAWHRQNVHPYRPVYTTDLDALVIDGLAESRVLEGCGKRCTKLLYRVTEMGCSVPVLEWFGRDPEHPIYTDHDGRPMLKPPVRLWLYGGGH
jgi:hypothetical protein